MSAFVKMSRCTSVTRSSNIFDENVNLHCQKQIYFTNSKIACHDDVGIIILYYRVGITWYFLMCNILTHGICYCDESHTQVALLVRWSLEVLRRRWQIIHILASCRNWLVSLMNWHSKWLSIPRQGDVGVTDIIDIIRGGTFIYNPLWQTANGAVGWSWRATSIHMRANK